MTAPPLDPLDKLRAHAERSRDPLAALRKHAEESGAFGDLRAMQAITDITAPSRILAESERQSRGVGEEFRRSFRGQLVEGNIGALGETLEALGAERVGGVLRHVGEGNTHQPVVGDFRDIRSLHDAAMFVAQGGGQALGSMVPTIAGSLAGTAVGGPVGGVVGGLAPSYVLGVGEGRSQLREAGVEGEALDDLSLLAGIPMAALERIVPGRVASRSLARGVAGVTGTGTRHVAAAALRDAGTEGLTEMAQDAFLKATVASQTATPESVRGTTFRDVASGAGDLVNSGLIGAIGGGFAGGGSASIEVARGQTPQARPEIVLPGDVPQSVPVDFTPVVPPAPAAPAAPEIVLPTPPPDPAQVAAEQQAQQEAEAAALADQQKAEQETARQAERAATEQQRAVERAEAQAERARIEAEKLASRERVEAEKLASKERIEAAKLEQERAPRENPLDAIPSIASGSAMFPNSMNREREQQVRPAVESAQPGTRLVIPEGPATYVLGEDGRWLDETDPENTLDDADEAVEMLVLFKRGTIEPAPTSSGMTSTSAPAVAPDVPTVPATEPGTVGSVPVADIDMEPDRFQFKLNTDERGVTRQLDSVEKWDPNKAGVVQVWRDPEDGRLKVVNGHHRLALAQRLGVENINVMEIDAPSAEKARTIGATTNIAEGRGTAVDAAKLIRDTGLTREELEAEGVSMTEGLARDGLALSNLPQALFSEVVAGRLPVKRGAVIGGSGLTEAEQLSLHEMLGKREQSGRTLTNAQVSELIRFVQGAGTTDVQQETLFGEETMAQSLAPEKAELSAYVKDRLSKDRRLFGFLTKGGRAARIEGEGVGQIDAGEAGRVSNAAARAEEVYNRLSIMSGPISDALNQAARELAEGGERGEIQSRLWQSIQPALARELEALTGGQGRRDAGSRQASQDPAADQERRDPTTEDGATGAVDTETGSLFERSPTYDPQSKRSAAQEGTLDYRGRQEAPTGVPVFEGTEPGNRYQPGGVQVPATGAGAQRAGRAGGGSDVRSGRAGGRDGGGVQASEGSQAVPSTDPDGDRVAEQQRPSVSEVETWADSVRKDLGLQRFNVALTRAGDLHLQDVEVASGERQQGLGTAAIEALTDFADQHGLRTVLTPGLRDSRRGTTSRSRLVRFYRRHGFVENKGRRKDFTLSEGMYREPEPRRSPQRRTDEGMKLRGSIFGLDIIAEQLQEQVQRARAARTKDADEVAVESVSKEIEARLRSSEGLPGSALGDRLRENIRGLWRSFRRHFRHLDPESSPAMAQNVDILRVLEAAPSWARTVTAGLIAETTKGLSPNQVRLMTRVLVTADLTRDLEEGKYGEVDPETGEHTRPLPFGYTVETLAADAEHYASLVEGDEKVGEALKRRRQLARQVTEQLVDRELLPAKVLEDDRYYHRQVLSHWAARQSAGVGVSSRDVRVHRKGFQKQRQGGTSDYNTSYLESEYEWLAQAHSLIATKDALNRLKAINDIRTDLKNQAKADNLRRFYEIEKFDPHGLADAEETPADDRTEAQISLLSSDPLAPYAQRIAMGMGRLTRMAKKGELIDGPYKAVVDALRVGRGQHPDFFAYLSWIMAEEQPGAPSAGQIFKAIHEREQRIRDTLKREYQTWEDLVPDSHTIWQPEQGSHFFMASTVEDRVLSAVIEGELDLTDEHVREAFVLGGPKEQWVIPAELAATMDEFRPHQRDEVDDAWVGVQSSWKQWVLINPARIAKYNLNNMSGDLDILLAYDPSATKLMPQAIRDIVAWKRGRATPALRKEMEELVRLGVMDSGFEAVEIPDLWKAGVFKGLTDSKGNVLQSGLRRYWQASREFTNARENWLRVVAYRHIQSQLAAGKAVLGASKPKEVRALLDPNERAAKIARELIGDYGNLTVAGQWARKRIIPFYSWLEINAPRYVRLLRNAAVEGDRQAAGRTVAIGTLAVGKGAAKRVAITAVQANLLMAAAAMWNHIFFPDEEDELRDQGREAHLILGRTSDGRIRTLRVEGALSDALDWFALGDWPAEIRDLMTGEKRVRDVAAEAVKAPAERLIQGWEPVSKTLFETLTGRTLWPNMFGRGTDFSPSPRPIRDRAEHVASTLSVRWLYQRVTGKPARPGRNNPFNLLLYHVEPGEAAYYEVRDKARRWQDAQGRGRSGGDPTDRSSALAYYRQAVRWGDAKAADKWLARYKELGGTPQGMKQSIRMSAPLGGLSTADRGRFVRSLSPQDREIVRRAERWYQQSLRPPKRRPERRPGTVRPDPAAAFRAVGAPAA